MGNHSLYKSRLTGDGKHLLSIPVSSLKRNPTEQHLEAQEQALCPRKRQQRYSYS
jgi:hypothetical protein